MLDVKQYLVFCVNNLINYCVSVDFIIKYFLIQYMETEQIGIQILPENPPELIPSQQKCPSQSTQSSAPISKDPVQGQKNIQISRSYEKVKCINGLTCQLICIDSDCTHFAFLCDSQTKCSCYKQHQNCLKASLSSLLSSLAYRKQAFLPIKLTIIDFIDQTIDQLSKYKESLQKEMQFKYQEICLNEDQRNFIQCLQSGELKNICGKNMSLIYSKIDFTFKVNEIVHKTTRDMQKTWKILQKEIATFETDFKLKLNRCTLVQESFFFKSQIITTFQQTNNIKQFLNKKIKSASLLYRASDNAFALNQFFDKCSYTRNTLTLALTQGGKIVGGFNPWVWIKSNNDEYLIDDSQTAFIFSLSDNEKVALTKKDKAIRNLPGFGPVWGDGYDFAIANQAHSNENSQAGISSAYTNDKYKNAQKTAVEYQRFHGGKAGSPNFKIKQWQVWKIEFDQ